VSEGAARRSKPDLPGLVIAAALFVAAAVVAADGARLNFAATYGLGPEAMPYLVAGGLALLALGNAVLAWQGSAPREAIDRQPILLILGGFALLAAIIGLGGGFIVATAILFAATATAFGRRAILTDLAIGLGLALVIYLLFVKALTLGLPEGPLERALDAGYSAVRGSSR
jgi:putative tricarboxylic transport membrane protein